MKKFIQGIPMVFLLATGLIFVPSCRKPCKDVICANQGTTREEGKECVCDCLTGYEGKLCETEVRTKFIESWMGNDTCTSDLSGTGVYAYVMRITTGSGVDQIDIANINGFGYDHIVTAKVSGTSFTIEPQITSGKTFEGSGSLAGGVIEVTYTIKQGSAVYSCSGSFVPYEEP